LLKATTQSRPAINSRDLAKVREAANGIFDYLLLCRRELERKLAELRASAHKAG